MPVALVPMILQAVLTYGPGVVSEVLTWIHQNGPPSIEDLNKLHGLLGDPGSYWGKQ